MHVYIKLYIDIAQKKRSFSMKQRWNTVYSVTMVTKGPNAACAGWLPFDPSWKNSGELHDLHELSTLMISIVYILITNTYIYI